ncbi:MAG: shikimate dehydrogenase [Phenylobacterium zucineum]|nr:MAG: shikimate dehydrogenase [Phenylobacterium zucineum]
MMITGKTRLAGVVGQPIGHSLSPILHNAWLKAADIDGIYAPFALAEARFEAFIEGLRGGSVSGLNVTLPFKIRALAVADQVRDRARLAGAANVLVFQDDGTILADNTDGLGLILAFSSQAPGFNPQAGPVAIIGAGGGAQGAAAAFLEAGCPEVRLLNRTFDKAEQVANSLGKGAQAWTLAEAGSALHEVIAVINATSAGLLGAGLNLPLEVTPPDAVIMDMTYKPLITPLLSQAVSLGRRTVDGLEMLIGQARPSFAAFFGQDPPEEVDVRRLALDALEAGS